MGLISLTGFPHAAQAKDIINLSTRVDQAQMSSSELGLVSSPFIRLGISMLPASIVTAQVILTRCDPSREPWRFAGVVSSERL